MIHQPLGGAQGQAADIEIQANEIMVSFSVNFYSCRKLNRVSRHTTQHHKSTLNGYLAEFTGKPLEMVRLSAHSKSYTS
jgi:ATP-dependent Clp protease protease subunit|tara:strand:- start:890 stop:1126 length:237 start_codon:yes stop_codon:yes gene_type:complete